MIRMQVIRVREGGENRNGFCSQLFEPEEEVQASASEERRFTRQQMLISSHYHHTLSHRNPVYPAIYYQ